jgi:predicted permease
MDGILEVVSQNILPIFMVAGLGAAARIWLNIDKQTVSRLTLYVLSPSLVFSSLLNSQVSVEEIAGIAAFRFSLGIILLLIAWVVGRGLRLGRREMAGLLLVVLVGNNGNYGITISQLRYGADGMARGVLYFVLTTVLVYTVGIFIASAGKADWRTSLGKLARMPAFYALIFAFLVRYFQLPLPTFIAKGIEIAGNGAIPVMLVVLGMQMADLRQISALRLAIPAIGLRLIAAPLIGVLLATLFGLTGLTRSIVILQASMPTAVITIIIATEFDAVPDAVTTVVILSTLLSPVTVSLLINLLGL